MIGKTDKRRPRAITRADYDDNWARTFGPRETCPVCLGVILDPDAHNHPEAPHRKDFPEDFDESEGIDQYKKGGPYQGPKKIR